MRAARDINTSNGLNYFRSVSPYTGEEIARYAFFTPTETDEALTRLTEDARILAGCAPSERSEVLTALADMLLTRKERLARIVTSETGKLYSEALNEINESADCLRYYADHAEDILSRPDAYVNGGGRVRSVYRPIGNVLAIMSWNFPLWQVVQCLAPNFLLGNGIALKHAANVQGCAQALEEWVTETLNLQTLVTLRIPRESIAAVIHDPRIAVVSLSGDEKSCSAIAATAGKALKKTVIESGGSDPYLVLKDADIDRAAGICLRSRLINAGQSSVAAKRFIIASPVYADFIDAIKAHAQAYRAGDPEHKDTTLAPLAKRESCVHMRDVVADAVACGASVISGGCYDEESPFYPVTVLADINETMEVFHDEILGPVVSIIRADSERHAIFLANFSDYGLGGAVFSEDETHALAVAEQLNTGGVAINNMYRSMPGAPFGGIGKSGYGRKLGGADGMAEFANLKTYFLP